MTKINQSDIGVKAHAEEDIRTSLAEKIESNVDRLSASTAVCMVFLMVRMAWDREILCHLCLKLEDAHEEFLYHLRCKSFNDNPPLFADDVIMMYGGTINSIIILL